MINTQQDKIKLINEVQKALDDIIFGSVELYVQNGKVTQITVRNIKKTGISMGTDIQEDNPPEKELNGITRTRNGIKTNLNIKLGS